MEDNSALGHETSKINYEFFVVVCIQVHVWAGISRQGATRIAIFQGIMDSNGYQSILRDYLKPFIEEKYPTDHRLWQVFKATAVAS